MEESQLLRGILEGCVLSIISRGETYGYELLNELANKGFTGLLEGTLYPILTRLNNKGFIKCRKQKSSLGPIRKYYSITDEGKVFLEKFKENYKNVIKSSNNILFNGRFYK